MACAGATDADGASAPGFELIGGKVAPKKAYFDGVRPVTARINFDADGPSDLTIQIKRRGRPVHRVFVRDVEPGVRRIEVWDGMLESGKAAGERRYRAFVKPAGGEGMPLGRFRLYRHIFPVRGKHGTRGSIGDFGAPRDDDRVHEGFDVVAGCGTPIVAARGGRVTHRGYDGDLYGNFIEIKGRKEGRRYFYAHLPKAAGFKVGDQVRTGERIGRVGKTGNARTIGCHLHFEIHRRGRPIDPEPDLRHWDSYS